MNGIDRMAQELEILEECAGEQSWGGEFREEMFDYAEDIIAAPTIIPANGVGE